MSRRDRTHLGEQPTATPDVEDVQAPENIPPLLHAAPSVFPMFVPRDLDEFFAEVSHPGRVHPVEEREFAMLVPPQRREAREMSDFVRVDGRGSLKRTDAL